MIFIDLRNDGISLIIATLEKRLFHSPQQYAVHVLFFFTMLPISMMLIMALSPLRAQ